MTGAELKSRKVPRSQWDQPATMEIKVVVCGSNGDSNEDWAGKSALSETNPIWGSPRIKVVCVVI